MAKKYTEISKKGENEINYVLVKEKYMVQDVTDINTISIGSNHRPLRVRFKIPTKSGRKKLQQYTKSSRASVR